MKEKYRVYKNVLVICLAFLCQFTAFNGIGNLQSSINCEDGLGTATLASIYAGLVVSCMFLPTLTIQKIGLKWTLSFSILGYLVYTLCNFYPSFYTLTRIHIDKWIIFVLKFLSKVSKAGKSSCWCDLGLLSVVRDLV